MPANEIVGLGPGELFVHRNIANLAPPLDANVQSVLQYAVEALKVKHIIVCGHYGCGGVLAALREWSGLPLENWLAHVRAVYREHKAELDAAPSEEIRWRRLCELNVMAQVHAVRQNRRRTSSMATRSTSCSTWLDLRSARGTALRLGFELSAGITVPHISLFLFPLAKANPSLNP